MNQALARAAAKYLREDLRTRLEANGLDVCSSLLEGGKLGAFLLAFALNCLIVGLEIALFTGVSGTGLSYLKIVFSLPRPPTPFIHLINLY